MSMDLPSSILDTNLVNVPLGHVLHLSKDQNSGVVLLITWWRKVRSSWNVKRVGLIPKTTPTVG